MRLTSCQLFMLGVLQTIMHRVHPAPAPTRACGFTPPIKPHARNRPYLHPRQAGQAAAVLHVSLARSTSTILIKDREWVCMVLRYYLTYLG